MTIRTRTENYKLNLSASLFCHFVTIVLSFVTRSVSLKILGKEYIGLSGLYSTVLSTIALIEMGFGRAVMQTFYKPIAENDTKTLSQRFFYLKSTYRKVAVLYLAIGIFTGFFIGNFLKEDIDKTRIIFFMYVIFEASSYLFAPYRMLVMSDQRNYVLSASRGVFFTLVTALQISVLITTGSYVLFVLARIVIFAAEDIFISHYASKKYKFKKTHQKVGKDYIASIKKKVRGLLYHKAGSTVCNFVGNAVISSFFGLSVMGIYSNYAMIISAVSSMIGLVLNSASAGIGNISATESKERSEKMFKVIFFVNFCLCVSCCTVLVNSLSPIIRLWLGKDMLFDKFTVTAIVISYFVSDVRDPATLFRNAYGLFYEERKKPIWESIVFIASCLFLVRKIGISGIYIARIISKLLVCMPYEPYILYKHGFEKHDKKYFFVKQMYKYFLIFMFIMLTSSLITAKINTDNVFGIICIISASFVYSVLMLFVFFSKSEEFIFIKEKFIRKFLP